LWVAWQTVDRVVDVVDEANRSGVGDLGIGFPIGQGHCRWHCLRP
jgi:hypothetical protein